MSTVYGSARSRPRGNRVLLMLVLVVFVNLPAVHSTWSRWRVDQVGIQTTGTVVDTDIVSPDDEPTYFVTFEYPDDIDPSRWPAAVDKATFDAAQDSGEIQVRYLEGRPSAYEVEGQQRQWLGLIITLVADFLLLMILLLAWRYGGRRRPLAVRLAAIEDVERCSPGGMFEQVEGDLYVVRGEVTEMGDGELLLDLGDRDVLVILDGHDNPVGYQQPAQVRGRLLP